jgi:hypothetical protein
MDTKILDVFNLDKPCPEDIKEACTEARKEYLEKMKNAQEFGSCIKCAENNIKSYLLAKYTFY